MATDKDDLVNDMIPSSIREAWRKMDNACFGIEVQSPVPIDDPSRKKVEYFTSTPVQALIIETMEKMVASLPPPPPDQEFHFHPSTRVLPKFKEIEEANKSAWDMVIFPMVECEFMPFGTVAFITYGKQGRCRTVESVQFVSVV